MATRTECPFYDNCGFVKWRQERPSEHMQALPEDGDCGKIAKTCSRYEYATSSRKEREQIKKIYNVENVYTHELPVSQGELKIVFPLLPNANGRPKRRLIGGGHQ